MIRVFERQRDLLALIVVLIVASFVNVQVARADVFIFVLNNGGRVRGDWLNQSTKRVPTYKIRTEHGGRMSLARSQVKDLIRERSEELDAQIAPQVPDTIEGQWQLAEWCRERRLTKQRTTHLQRVIALDTDHVRARGALGYTQDGNRWLTREDWRKKEGYVYYRGKWRLEQDVDLLEANGKRERSEREWIGKVKRLRKAFDSERASEALQQILAIRDPHAVRAVTELLRKEPFQKLKLSYVKVLGQIGDHGAVLTLINASLNDPDLEIYHACVDQIVPLKPQVAVTAYIKGLRNQNNVRVNRAANALGQIGDEQAVAPLIDALVTTHHQVVAFPSSGSGLPLSTTFARPAACKAQTANPLGTGFTAGGNQPQVISRPVPNQEVLHSLVKLTGGPSFGYDQKAWLNWYTLEKRKTQQTLTSRVE